MPISSSGSIAADKKAVIGDGYIGGDVIDLGSPILSTVAALVESAQQQAKFMLMKDPKGGFVKAAEAAVAALDGFVAAAAQTVNHEDGRLAKVLESRGKLSAVTIAFQTDDTQRSGSPEVRQVTGRLVASLEAMLKQLGAFVEVATSTRAGGAPVRTISQNNTMLELLNAEAEAVACRRELQFAEDMLKALTASK